MTSHEQQRIHAHQDQASSRDSKEGKGGTLNEGWTRTKTVAGGGGHLVAPGNNNSTHNDAGSDVTSQAYSMVEDEKQSPDLQDLHYVELLESTSLQNLETGGLEYDAGLLWEDLHRLDTPPRDGMSSPALLEGSLAFDPTPVGEDDCGTADASSVMNALDLDNLFSAAEMGVNGGTVGVVDERAELSRIFPPNNDSTINEQQEGALTEGPTTPPVKISPLENVVDASSQQVRRTRHYYYYCNNNCR